MASVSSNYDDFAVIYARHWGPRYAKVAWETLNGLIVPYVRPGSELLDLCCGAGQISRVVADRGFHLTGIDVSSALISLARSNAPICKFEVADARSFKLPNVFNGAFSLNDSLNHLLSLEDLRSSFRSVFECVIPGGVFLFDLNLAHKYENSWSGSIAIVEEDAVCAGFVAADIAQKRGNFNVAVFSKHGTDWKRKDLELVQTWYDPETVIGALREVGFVNIAVTDRQGNEITDWRRDKAYFRAFRPL